LTGPNLERDGFLIIDRFLSDDQCSDILGMITAYRGAHEVPLVFRESGKRPLNYRVIDGHAIRAHLPSIDALLGRVNSVINDLVNEEVVPLADTRVACNVNITEPGGTYRWHYDRNAITALLYLNSVEGGETEMYPNYRFRVGSDLFSRKQRFADALFRSAIVKAVLGTKVVCEPVAGRLLIMKGNTCLHSVRPVSGRSERINVVLSYDRPGTEYAVAGILDSYLYTTTAAARKDPNYA
jgi:hypothetical protein